MPIRPENIDKYPPHWRWISTAVKFRAGNRCEGSPDYPACRAENGLPHPETGSKVVLTTAHLDHDPSNNDGMQYEDPALPKEQSNLRAWCQRCSLHFNKPHHLQNRYVNSRAHKAVGDLFEEMFYG